MNLAALPGTGPLLDFSAAARSTPGPVSGNRNMQGDTFQPAPVSEQFVTVPAPSRNVSSGSASVTPQADALLQTQPGTTDHVPAASSALESLSSQRDLNAATDSQRSTQAFQEYAKAWGGRVVHGEVELPPLSIYVE